MKYYLISILMISFALAETRQHERLKNRKHGTREVSVIVTDYGYFPEKFSVFEGETVKFFVTNTSKDSSCMMVAGHKVFLAAQKGKITEGKATFEKAGEYNIYCPTHSNKAKITVLKKKSLKQMTRKPASVKKKYWMPREY